MPCFQEIQWHDVMFKNRKRLEDVVKALGWSINGNTIVTDRGQVMTLDGIGRLGTSAGTDVVNQLKVAYTQATIKEGAAKYGWQRTKVNANKFVLSKGV